MSKNDKGRLQQIKRALRDYNVSIVPFPALKLVPRRQSDLWAILDPPSPKKVVNTSALVELTQKVALQLTFPVRYQLEVCLSQGYFNTHNISADFIDRLNQIGAVQAQDLLEYVANQRKRVYEPMILFEMKITSGADARARIPHYCTFIRSATVTPTTIIFETPTVETSNRVIRQYSEHADRFLRVRFADEKPEVVAAIPCMSEEPADSCLGQNPCYRQEYLERGIHAGQADYDEWNYYRRPALPIPGLWQFAVPGTWCLFLCPCRAADDPQNSNLDGHVRRDQGRCQICFSLGPMLFYDKSNKWYKIFGRRDRRCRPQWFCFYGRCRKNFAVSCPVGSVRIRTHTSKRGSTVSFSIQAGWL